MKEKLSIENIDYLERHLFDEDLCTKFKLDRTARRYIAKAKKLPFEDMCECIDICIEADDINYYSYLANITCKYNTNLKELLNRLKEVSRIRAYRSNKVLKLKK